MARRPVLEEEGAILVDATVFSEFPQQNQHHQPMSVMENVPLPPRKNVRVQGSSQPRGVDRFPVGSHRVLGTLGITAITYFIGCGGPLGSEPIISASGPAIGLSAMLLYPLFVTVPYAYILAELCTAFPEDGGFVVWVLNAFGPFWSFQVGYWSWVGGIFNGALLPGLLIKLLMDSFKFQFSSKFFEFLVKVTIALVVSVPSFLGTKSVERTCIILVVLVLVPMIVFTVWGFIVGSDYVDLTEVRHGGRHYFDNTLEDEVLTGPIRIDWRTLVNNLFWNYDGIAMASVFGGEVSNPARVYPRAIFFTVALTVATYFIPMPAAVITQTPHWTMYETDSYPFIALTIGGRVLEKFVLFSSVCGIGGLFLSGLYCKSFQLCGMAENRLLPTKLGLRNARFDSPHVSLAVTLCFMLMLLSIDFSYLLPVANTYLCAVQLLIIAAAVRLRLLLPFIPRPTKVPGGIWVMGVFSILPIIVLGYISIDSMHTPEIAAIIGTLLVPGILIGAYQQFRSDSMPSPMMFA